MSGLRGDFVGPEVSNKNCILVSKTGLTPFRRCRYCEKPLSQCFSFQFSLISILVIILTLFLVEMESLRERLILGGVAVLWAVLVYLVSREADRLVEAEYVAQQSLKEKTIAEEKYRRLFEDASDAIYIIDPETARFLDCNRRALEMLGYSKEELLNMKVFDINPPEQKEAILEGLSRQVMGESINFETIHIAKDGSPIDVEVTSRLINWENKKVIESFVRDISLRKEAERQQADLLRLFNESIENMPEGVFLLDNDHTVVFANTHAKESLKALGIKGPGERLESIGDKSPEELVISPPRILWHEIVLSERVFNIGARRLKTGFFDGYIFVIRDITEARQREERIYRQERLASLGQLASGIAHDFRNLLTIIIGSAENLSERELPGAVGYEVEAILESAYKAASMIEQILDFSRARKTNISTVNLEDTLHSFKTFMKRLLPENIELVLDIETPGLKIKGNENMLQQALANLIINARDAMPEGGRITISLTEREFSNENLPLPEMSPGRWAILQVKDTGKGIPKDILDRVLEPFFTTKAEGTGLGLSQVYGIVSQHRGYMDIQSEEGSGTTVTIYLPFYIEEPPVKMDLTREFVPEGKGERVLIVEDEEELARMLQADLENHGYKASIARNGREALEVMEREEFSLVITDLMMPEMGGKDLLGVLKKRAPDIKTIVITGYATEMRPEYLKEIRGVPVLSKPFSLRQLRLEIARLMGRGE